MVKCNHKKRTSETKSAFEHKTSYKPGQSICIMSRRISIYKYIDLRAILTHVYYRTCTRMFKVTWLIVSK